MPSDFYDKYDSVVRRVSSEYAGRYRNFVERDDVTQALWLWFVEHPKKLASWEAENDEKEVVKLVARSLRNAALDYCTKERAVKTGYEYEDIFWYDTEFLKTLLPAALTDDWRKVEAMTPEGKTFKSPAESGDWIAYAADVRKAFDSLPDEDKRLVFLFYVEDMTGNDVHEVVGGDRPSSSATMMAANRALKKMVKQLGGRQPFQDHDYEDKPEEA